MQLSCADNIVINYEVYGSGPRILLIHGWGANLTNFSNIIQPLSQNFQVFALDLPGFGLSSLPSSAYTVEDFAQVVSDFIDNLELDSLTVLGHSFGGAVAVLAALTNSKIKKVVLVDPAIIRQKTIKTKLKITFYKMLKKAPYLHKFGIKLGSPDYQASGALKPTFLKIINQDLQKYLPHVWQPVLVLWGQYDKETPITEAPIVNRLLPNSKLLIIAKSGHFPHLENSRDFLKALTKFLDS